MLPIEMRQQYEPHIHEMGNVTVRTVMDQRLPSRRDLKNPESKILYEDLSDKSLMLYKTQLADGSVEMYAFGEPLDGKQLNSLLYFPAPSRIFGDSDFDIDDTLMDWMKLFDGSEESEALLKAHRHIPNWMVFETERIILLESLAAYRNPRPQPPGQYFVPVMAWRAYPDGHFEWLVDVKKTQSFERVKASHLGKQVSLPENKYSLLVGSLLAASYSPEITTTWKDQLSYALKEQEKNEATQDMGPTQALPLVLGFSQQLLESQFVISVEEKMGLSSGKRVSTRPALALPLLGAGLVEDDTVEATPVTLPLTGGYPVPQADMYKIPGKSSVSKFGAPAGSTSVNPFMSGPWIAETKSSGSFIPNPASHMPENKTPPKEFFPSPSDFFPQDAEESYYTAESPYTPKNIDDFVTPYEGVDTEPDGLEPFNTIVKNKKDADALDPAETFFTQMLNRVLQDQVVGIKTINMPENIQQKGPWLEAFLSTLNILREDEIIKEGIAVAYTQAVLGLLYKMGLD